MAFTIPEALKHVQNRMTAGILRSVATTSELGVMISIEPEEGIGLKLDREGLLPTTEFIGDDGVTTEESTGADDIPIVQFRRIVGNMDHDGLAEAATPTQRNRLIGKKAKATWRLMKDKLINGGHVTSHVMTPAITAIGTGTGTDGIAAYGPWLDSTRRGPGNIKIVDTSVGVDGTCYFRAPGDMAYGPGTVVDADADFLVKSHNESNWITVTIDASDIDAADLETTIRFVSSNDEYDGIFEMVHPTMVTAVIASNGDAFAIDMLDDLIDVQKIRENRAFLMNGKILNKYYALQRALGGSDPDHVAIPGYGAPVPTYRGIPILTEDNINDYTRGTAQVSDIALVSLDPNEGLVLGAQTTGGEAGAFSPDADPRVRSVLGFRITNVGELEGKDATRTRVKFYGAPALKSYLALAVKQGVFQSGTI